MTCARPAISWARRKPAACSFSALSEMAGPAGAGWAGPMAAAATGALRVFLPAMRQFIVSLLLLLTRSGPGAQSFTPPLFVACVRLVMGA
jgi:hypothetical protein